LDYQTLLKGVKLYKKLSFDKSYKKYVLNRRQIWENLDQITENEVKNTIIGFLKAWGIRNTNRIKPHELKESLKGLNKRFKILRGKSLINLDFNEKVNINGQKKISEVIKEIYQRLLNLNGIGSTSASKIMHCVVPEIFMMWDENIRKGYGYAGNEIGYLRFIHEMQRILRRVMETYSKSPEELIRKAYPNMNKTLTKLLDEFNYMKFTRGKKEGKDLPNPIEEL